MNSMRATSIDRISQFANEAINEAFTALDLDKDDIERIVAHQAELKATIREATRTSLLNLSATDRFKDQEVSSNCLYPVGYKVKDVREQITILRDQLLGNTGYANKNLRKQIHRREVELPGPADGWYVFPNWRKRPEIFGETLHEAMTVVFEAICRVHGRKLRNYLESELKEQQFVQSPRTEEFLGMIADTQGNLDILIVPAQSGIYHRGQSMLRATELFSNDEFGLGPFEVAIILLTHKRLRTKHDLRIDCVGGKLNDSHGAVSRSHAPCFYLDGRRFRFAPRRIDHPRDCFGSATGFFLQ